jgi:[acyl-carrier-protein] S-malonyltransferase
MQKAASGSSGAMCAVIGKTPAEIEEICSSVDGYVVPVNYNSPAQTVIAGKQKHLTKPPKSFLHSVQR